MSQRTAAVIALALGLGLLAGAGQFARNARQLTTVGERVPGTVMDFQRRSSKGGSSEYPVIEFTTTTGDTRHFTTSGAGDYARGEKVEVLYHPPIRTAPRWMPSWSCGWGLSPWAASVCCAWPPASADSSSRAPSPDTNGIGIESALQVAAGSAISSRFLGVMSTGIVWVKTR